MIRLWVVTSLKVPAWALAAMLAVGCASVAAPTPKPPLSPTSTPKPSLDQYPDPRPSSAVCVTGAAKGECGPYDSYARITGTTSVTNIGNNVWNPIPGWHQTLYATNPGNWHVTSDMPAGNTAVVAYPSIGANYGAGHRRTDPAHQLFLHLLVVHREHERNGQDQCLGNVRHLARPGQMQPVKVQLHH